MKKKSQITIILTGLALLLRIIFVFIEQNKTFSKNIQEKTQVTNNKIKEEAKNQKITIKEIQEEGIEENITEQFNIVEQSKEDIEKPIIIKQKKSTSEIIPKDYNIQDMDFFSQAPYGDRNQPYQDACEEASLLIGQYYINGIKKTKEEYNKDLLAMVELEMEMLGYFESTTIMEMKQIINKRDPSITARIIEHPTIADLEKEISKKNIVIAPLYGKGLGNPHYALGGPEYHFLVIKGYTTDSFITHDVGTIHGANRHYNKNLIMENIHDRNRIDVRKGAPRVLILEKY